MRFNLFFDGPNTGNSSGDQSFAWDITYFENGTQAGGFRWTNDPNQFDTFSGVVEGTDFGGEFFALPETQQASFIPMPTPLAMAGLGLVGVSSLRRRRSL